MRHVLILTYYWPPSGGPGVQRVLKFSRYLRDFGWAPTVLTVRNGAYPNLDPTLASEIPDSVSVHRTSSWDPYSLYARWLGKERAETVSVGFLDGDEDCLKKRLARWVRANVFLPDARVGWVPFGIREHRRMNGSRDVDAVLSSGPPHSTHLIARSLRRRLKVPWIADFRDPWTDVTYCDRLPATRLARKLDESLEKTVLADADLVTTVSPSWQDLLAQKSATPIELIRNGFDPTDLRNVEPCRTDAFVITYVGNFSPARNPVGLWKVLADLRGRLPELRLRIVGNVDRGVLTSLTSQRLGSLLERIPYVPHREALAYMKGGTLLLLTLNRSDGPEFAGHVPAKLYEYLATGRPVLGIGGTQTDAARLLSDTGGGTMVDYGDTRAIRSAVQQQYRIWKDGRPPRTAGWASLEPLTRQRQTGRLARLLDALQRAPVRRHERRAPRRIPEGSAPL